MIGRVSAISQSVYPLHMPRAEGTRAALERSLLYSEELGIDLVARSDAVYFHWFLASVLFGARISETTAKNTYRSFVRHGLTSPRKIIRAGWDFLVFPVMRDGGYVRYDGRKSDQVLRDCEALIADYSGSLRRLHEAAGDARNLEERLLAFHGLGPVTVNIFLRESYVLSGQRRIPIPCRWFSEWRSVFLSTSRVTTGRA